jgi:hypothetical protein
MCPTALNTSRRRFHHRADQVNQVDAKAESDDRRECQSGPRFHVAHDPISLNQRVQGSSPYAPTIELVEKA